MNVVPFLKRQILGHPGKHLSPKEISLHDVRVAFPCPASWEQMAGDDRVRFCSQCQLNVYSLSEMTRREAERLVANREGQLCVRFYRRADGTMLTHDCPRPLRVLARRVSRIAGIALYAIMSISCGTMQTPQRPASQSPLKNTPRSVGIWITVLDQSAAIIQGAQVTVVDEKGQRKISAITDSKGQANFPELRADVYSVSVSAKYFQASMQMVRLGTEPLTLKLTLPLFQGDAIEVPGMPIETQPAAAPPSLTPEPIQPLPKVKKPP